MNGRYGLASSRKERIGIAVIAGIHAYFNENPQGVIPGESWLGNWIDSFIEQEILEEIMHDRMEREHNNPEQRHRQDIAILERATALKIENRSKVGLRRRIEDDLR